jgi:hypothetical protein
LTPSSPPPNSVISTEGGAFAAAAEKSASPPAPIPSTAAPLHLSLFVPILAVILSGSEGSRCSPPNLYLSNLPANDPAVSLHLQRAKINFEKVENFSRRIRCHFQPRFHHKSTTIYHANTTFCTSKSAKPPAKSPFSPA